MEGAQQPLLKPEGASASRTSTPKNGAGPQAQRGMGCGRGGLGPQPWGFWDTEPAPGLGFRKQTQGGTSMAKGPCNSSG